MISANLKTALEAYEASFFGEDILTVGGTANAGTALTINRMMNPDVAPVFAHRAPAVKAHDMN